MSFEIRAKIHDKEKGKKSIDIDITQDGKKFYSVKHEWWGVKEADDERFGAIIAPLLGTMEFSPSGFSAGLMSEDEMICFEIGLTKVAKAFNAWAIEDATNKGREVDKARVALSEV